MTASRLTVTLDDDGAEIESVDARGGGPPKRWAPWHLGSISIRDALVAIRVTHARPAAADDDRLPLASLVRAIGHVVADHGLLRPIVVYIEPPVSSPEAAVDESKLAEMKRWEDDQDWHRGRFVFCARLPSGLLEPRIEGLEQPTTEDGEADPGGPSIAQETDIDRLDAIAREHGWTGDGLFTTVRDWAKHWIKEHGRAEPTEDAGKDLDRAIASWVAAQPVPEPQLPVIVLASYSPEEPVPAMPGVSRDAEARLFLDATADEPTRRSWEAETFPRMVAIRQTLQQQRHDTVVLHARCTPAVAIRVGAVFHASTGLSTAVIQQNPATKSHELWQSSKDRSPQVVDLQVDRVAPTGPISEVQLRVSATWPVDRDADDWTSSAGPGVRPYILRITLPENADDSVRGADHAWDIARRVRKELTDLQKSLAERLPTRVFYAGPVALAVWIGAQLNAVGEVILMDWLKTASPPRYVATFTFQSGG